MSAAARIYCGTVCHTRLRPKAHRLSYNVFSFLVDIDRLDELAGANALFGYNRRAVFSIHDRDFGRGDGRPLGDHARQVLSEAGFESRKWTICLLAYPRVLGYVFNPLSVFYCKDAGGSLRAMIYEVTNTFGERRCYVVAAGKEQNGVFAHACRKDMYVSPFAAVTGRYGFRVTEPGERITVGVQLRDGDGPLIKTHFAGAARPFDVKQLLRIAVGYPLMTVKVIAGIHFEALRLWFKKLPLARRPAGPKFAVQPSRVLPASTSRPEIGG